MPAPTDDYVPSSVHIVVSGAHETPNTLVEVGITIDAGYGNHGALNLEMATVAAQAARDWLESHPTYDFAIGAEIDYVGHHTGPLP